MSTEIESRERDDRDTIRVLQAVSQPATIALALMPTLASGLISLRLESTQGKRLVAGLLVALGLSVFAGNAAAQPGTGTQSVYLGDAICSSCHGKEYDAYKKHGHSSMSVPTNGERPPDDRFPGGIALPELPINTATGQQMTWADVVEIFGNFKNGEGYLVRASDGKFVASGRVPTNSCIDCHDIPSQKHAKTPVASLQSESCAGCHHNFPAGYSPTCFKCHNTGYNPNGKQYGVLDGGWALNGIQCENCHGPAATMKIPDLQICRDCHSAGDPQFRVAFSAKSSVLIGSTGFTDHHAEGDEYRRSPHKDLGCIACHDPHRSVWHDEGGVKYAEKGIGNMCSKCHPNRVLGAMGQLGLECVDCHMPQISSNGNRANHLVRIGATPLAAGDNTYQADGGTWWNTDANGNSFLTLDLVCGNCHTDMTLSQMASYAKRIHHQSTYLDLWVDGSDGLQQVKKTQMVSVDFSVRANEKRGTLTDWWVLRRGVTGWSSWNGKKWVRGMKPWRKKFGLVDVPNQNVLNSKLPPGHYTFWVILNFADGTDEVAAVPLQVAK